MRLAPTSRSATFNTRDRSRRAAAKATHAEREKVKRIPRVRVTLANQSAGLRNRGAGPHDAPSQIARATTSRPPYAFGSSSIPESRAP